MGWNKRFPIYPDSNAYLPLGDTSITVGLNIFHDKLPVEQLSEVNAFVAKAIQISESNFLAVSVNFGGQRYVTTYSTLDPTDPNLQNDISENGGIIGASIMSYGIVGSSENKYYFGVSIPRFTKIGSEDEKRNLKKQYYITGGYTHKINDVMEVQPAVLVSYSANTPVQADFSTSLILQNKLSVGFNYRSTSELAGLASYTLNSKLRFGYSYQFQFGSTSLGNISNATHELGLSYNLGRIFESRNTAPKTKEPEGVRIYDIIRE